MKPYLLLTLALLSAFFALPSRARAQGTLVTNPSGGEYYNTPPPGTLGFSFMTGATPTAYDMLGVYDWGNDGLGASHVVTLFDSLGTPLTVGTIGAGGGATADSFQWVTVAPVVLLPNSSYVLAASYGSDDPDHFFLGTATLPSGFTLGNAVWADQAGGVDPSTFPTNIFATGQGFFGPNMEASPELNLESVPETSTSVVAALAAIMLTAQVIRARAFSRKHPHNR